MEPLKTFTVLLTEADVAHLCLALSDLVMVPGRKELADSLTGKILEQLQEQIRA